MVEKESNKTYFYHVIVDKDDNVLYKFPSKAYAVRWAQNKPQAVAVKEVTQVITERVVWEKENKQ